MIAALMVGCGYDDDELQSRVNENTRRIAALEELQDKVNDDIGTLQGLVSSLNGKVYVTGVTSVTDPAPGGVKITFTSGPDATIWNGTAGSTPVIGVAENPPGSGVYYWTLNGSWMPDADHKMRVTGADAIAPEVKIDTNEASDTYNQWLISTNGGTEWTPTGVEATGPQGDAIFAADGIDNSHSDYVVLTLADGETTITLPKVRTLTVGFDSYEPVDVSPANKRIAIVLPATLKAADYVALTAELKHENGDTDRDILTRAASVVQVTAPTFSGDGTYNGDAAVTINVPSTAGGGLAVLKVTLIDANGQEVSASRVVALYGNEFAAAIAAGGTITLTEDYIADATMPGLFIPADRTATIDLNGHTIETSEINQDAIRVEGNLTIEGDGFVTGKNSYAIWAIGDANVMINGGTYSGNFVCIQTNNNAAVEINDGYFSTPATWEGKYWVLDLQDNLPNTITVKGGLFKGCDPAATGLEDPGKDNLVAPGYKSTMTSAGPPAEYTVKKADAD